MRTDKPVQIIPASEATEWNCYAIYADPDGLFVRNFEPNVQGPHVASPTRPPVERVTVHSVYAPSNLQRRWVVDATYWMPIEERILAAHNITPV